CARNPYFGSSYGYFDYW
nr:immunoglobulin heavy chain junction region [Mus musculus]